MMDFIFLHPWVLAGLAVLPAVYFLLRIMPPTPTRIALPTLRFLDGLQGHQHTPNHTPWWLLLLRLLILGLIIVALAGPVYKPGAAVSGSGALRIVIDNSWASAQNWDTQLRAAENLIKRAGRDGRDIYILPTAASPGMDHIVQSDVMSAAQAISYLNAMEPMPWPASYTMATGAVAETKDDMRTFWFGHGLDEGTMARLARALLAEGSVDYIRPEDGGLPIALRWANTQDKALAVEILRPAALPNGRMVTLQILAESGRVLDQQTVSLSKDRNIVSFSLPEAFQDDAARIQIAGISSAGAALIIDENAKRRHVGIIAPREQTESKPFTEAAYYLKRALEPYSSLQFGTVSDILADNPSLIILPDIGAMPPESLGALERWVQKGGVLVRFAGPNMVEEGKDMPLIPVHIRGGGRAMDGAMTWENPVTIAPFEKSSPLYGTHLHEDILVRRQILAEPSDDLDRKSWARLSDGTPLITADRAGDGLLILVHTSATPAWSDLALSGVYVDILRRFVALSGQRKPVIENGDNGTLSPLWLLDGFGKKQKPAGSVQPVAAETFDKIKVSSVTPPGLYERAGYQKALNLGTHIGALLSAGEVANGVSVRTYEGEYERDFKPFLLTLALVLFLLDWVIMLFISGGLGMRIRLAAALLFCTFGAVFSPAHASEIQYSNALYMAYIKTGDIRVDNISQQGLRNLAHALKNRTSAEPDGVVALDPEHDELAFFPVIYWPITEKQTALSSSALEKVQKYLDHGGTILIDKRLRASERRKTPRNATLQSMIGSLNIPPMQPIPNGHVLGKSFYLLDHYPGLSSGDTLWVEARSANGRDGVSSIIIGSHNWAGAWANAENGYAGTRQYELALRFGVNLMMYALTGNYKADQVHLPAILERVGQ